MDFDFLNSPKVIILKICIFPPLNRRVSCPKGHDGVVYQFFEIPKFRENVLFFLPMGEKQRGSSTKVNGRKWTVY
jgi:hypothetical protein